MARKKAEETTSKVTIPFSPEMKNWVMFQENNELYVFHFCGIDEKNHWFRKTIDWDKQRNLCTKCNDEPKEKCINCEYPRCEACKLEVPEKMASLIKIHKSGLGSL